MRSMTKVQTGDLEDDGPWPWMMIRVGVPGFTSTQAGSCRGDNHSIPPSYSGGGRLLC